VQREKLNAIAGRKQTIESRGQIVGLNRGNDARVEGETYGNGAVLE
jgi:hypothetical protein